MTNYRMIKVPFPVDKAQEIMEQYEACRHSPGGIEIRYRMPKEMVKAGSIDGEDVDVSTEELTGMGLGKLMRMPLLVQPRQLTGFKSAKEKGKSYNLVLNRKQLDHMRGQGLFKDIASVIAKIAGPLLETVVPGSSEEFAKISDKVIGAVDNAILKPKAKKAIKNVLATSKREQDRVIKSDLPPEEKAKKLAKLVEESMVEATSAAKEVMGSGEDCDVCPHCMGSGFQKRKQKNLQAGVTTV